MKPRVIIFLCLGGYMLHFVKCYSDGNFDYDQSVCETMQVGHRSFQPQDSEPPFTVDPDNIIVLLSTVGNFTEVTLKAVSHEPFTGFMLEARKSDSRTPQGTFSLMDPRYIRLQQCAGVEDKAVTQKDNQRKTEIKVRWSASEPGLYFFRATFVKNFTTFWNFKEIPSSTLAPTSIPVSTPEPVPSSTPEPVPSSTPEPVTTIKTMSTSTTLSSVTTTAPPQPFLLKSSLTLHLLSYLFLAVCGPFLARAHMSVWMKVTSSLSFAFSLAAFILLLIDTKQAEGQILAGVATCLGLCQTILIFFLCGPIHELSKIFFWVLRMVAFINICFTIAAIYIGLVEYCSKNSCFLPIVLMGVYLACNLLSYPFYLYEELKQKSRPQTLSSKRNCRVSCWCANFVIFSGMNIAFTLALVLGIFLCRF